MGWGAAKAVFLGKPGREKRLNILGVRKQLEFKDGFGASSTAETDMSSRLILKHG